MRTNSVIGKSINWTTFVGILWPIIFIPNAIRILFQNRDMPSNIIRGTEFIENYILTLKDGNFFSYLLNVVLQTSFLFVPIIGITIFEIYINKKSTLKNFFSCTSVSKIFKSKGNFADFVCFIIKTFTGKFPIIATFLAFGTSNVFKPLNTWFANFYSNTIPGPINEFSATLIFLVVLLLSDFADYIDHRCQHAIAPLWEAHEFHHSATEMTLFTKDRTTPLETVLTAPLVLPITAFTGLILSHFISLGIFFPCYLFMAHNVIVSANGYIGHSSLKVVYPKPLSYIYMSPSLHWMHHSTHKSHYDTNFGLGFTFWDKLFGTYLDESNIRDVKAFGVENSLYNKYNPLYSSTFLPGIKIIRWFKGNFLAFN